jgi:hypothetical protein
MAKSSMNTYLNGASVRVHNKKINVHEVDGKVMIQFLFADENAETPACGHKCHRGKVRETFVQMSTEAMELLVHAYLTQKRYTIEQRQLEAANKLKEDESN